MRRASAIICAAFIIFTAARAFAKEKTGHERGKGMAGIAVNGLATGIQAEYRFIKPLAIRVMGIYVHGLGTKHSPVVTKGEHLFSAVITPVVYIPTPVPFLDPALFFGMSYSHYRWKAQYTNVNGIINDITFGGGAGLGFIIAPFCRIGINCWVNYDYTIMYDYGLKQKGPRMALIMPFVDVCFMF